MNAPAVFAQNLSLFPSHTAGQPNCGSRERSVGFPRTTNLKPSAPQQIFSLACPDVMSHQAVFVDASANHKICCVNQPTAANHGAKVNPHAFQLQVKGEGKS
jgi:hypothetical protein